KWEVRSLREPRGKRGEPFFQEALLEDFDFSNQHTDSFSVAMVELTASEEPVVRSLRHWEKDAAPCLKDLQAQRISYFYSNKHQETTRAKAGQNPDILSVIRLLTKALQYRLSLKKTDLTQLQKVIDKFDPAQPFDSIALMKIQKTGIKLIRQAIDIEYAVQTLEDLGLRDKLKLIGDPHDSSSLAFWMNKEPLRTFNLGEVNDVWGTDSTSDEFGKSAQELGLSELPLAHATSDYAAYESISRAKAGEPNAFISRDGYPGEMAMYGDGFYLRIGTVG